MTVVNAKAFTCAGCQKMITYGPQQAGTQIACPRCGEKAILPDADGQPVLRSAPGKKRRRFASCLFAGFGGCLGVLLLVVAAVVICTYQAVPLDLPKFLQSLCAPLASRGLFPVTAPAPATYARSDLSIAVTRMTQACPSIFQASLRKTAETETPVYCVTVAIQNSGDAAVRYRSWRDHADASAVGSAATLSDGAGNVLGTVSFGPGTWPVGAQPHAQILPGSRVTDILLFQCGKEAEGDFLLTLPGKNLGRAGMLRFRIPREMVE
jgi:predicted RNA-binding Zn-ribbon protein involved in translation (DUF1610 family)